MGSKGQRFRTNHEFSSSSFTTLTVKTVELSANFMDQLILPKKCTVIRCYDSNGIAHRTDKCELSRDQMPETFDCTTNNRHYSLPQCLEDNSPGFPTVLDCNLNTYIADIEPRGADPKKFI